MQVHIQNDGPVTIPLDSPDNLPDSKKKKTAMVAPSVQSLSINSGEGDNSGSWQMQTYLFTFIRLFIAIDPWHFVSNQHQCEAEKLLMNYQ